MPGAPSRFLDAIPRIIIEDRQTSGMFGGDLYRRPQRSSRWIAHEVDEPEMASQDIPRYVKGERVRHRRFGSGTITGISGVGRDLKVHVEFEDEEIGSKKLLIAYAGLERDWDGA